MATPTWQVGGQYYETCSCDFVCPCILGQMAVRPTTGSCTFAMAMHIDRGHFGDLSLDGLGFVVLGLTPEAMGHGNWSVGLVVDERASGAQQQPQPLVGAQRATLPNKRAGPAAGDG